MPFNKVEIFLWDLIKGIFERKFVRNIPDAQKVVHTTSNEPFTAAIELAEFDCLSMSTKLANFLCIEDLFQSWGTFSLAL